MQCINHSNRESTQSRPADAHFTGSPAAQRLCDECARSYDDVIAKRQQEYRAQRLKDLEKRHSNPVG